MIYYADQVVIMVLNLSFYFALFLPWSRAKVADSADEIFLFKKSQMIIALHDHNLMNIIII